MREEGRLLHDPIFKGCTRPPMLAGVPMVWLLLPAGGALLIAPYLLYLVSPVALLVEILLFVPFYGWMRAVTKLDDQRLPQIALRWWMRARHIEAFRYWGAVSFAPVRYRR